MKTKFLQFAMTAAILLLGGCSIGLRNEALQSCLSKAQVECNATVQNRCEDRTGVSRASCQKSIKRSCLAEVEKSCKKQHPEAEYENGNGGGGY
ncbi:MAG: hypothetical protein IIC64_07055 [SAR324 cluster bacterium]|nr:hypothetical protein [SAR324 cluster bacterium]